MDVKDRTVIEAELEAIEVAVMAREQQEFVIASKLSRLKRIQIDEPDEPRLAERLQDIEVHYRQIIGREFARIFDGNNGFSLTLRIGRTGEGEEEAPDYGFGKIQLEAFGDDIQFSKLDMRA